MADDDHARREATEPGAWRALAHPLRLRILEQLQMRPVQRASDLGTALGEAPNTMSFHLRQLARFGYVEESAPPVGRADARARWWSSTAPGGVRVEGDDEGAADLVRVMREHLHQQVDAWFDRDPASPSRSTNFDVHLAVTPTQWEQFLGELGAVLRHWMTVSREAPLDDPEVGEHVLVGFGAAATPPATRPAPSST